MSETKSLQIYLYFLTDLLDRGLMSGENYLSEIKKISEANQEELKKIIDVFKDNRKQ